MNDPFEKKLTALAQQTFNTRVSELDDDVLRRLRESRQKAIASISSPSKTPREKTIYFPAWLAPISTATAFASVAVITASLWLQPSLNQQLNQHSILSPLNDIALLSSADELDFYENLDFYIWLEEERTTQKDNNAS